VRITESARRRGIADEDMLHAITHHLSYFVDEGDEELVMFIGPARNGAVLEVGVVEDDEDPRIIHAMPARRKFWP
jgi:hypothetical protein